MFAGQSTTVTFDGLTPIAWATSALSTNLVYGPAGADHQTTTPATDVTGEGAVPGCGNGGTTPGCPANTTNPKAGDAGAAVVSWLYLDRQGTVRATADSTGITTSAAAYTDYGVLEPAAGTLYAGAGTEAAPGQEDRGTTPPLPVTTTVSPVGYTGEQINPAAGLNHYHARDYQPATTRWLQADPWAGDITMPATLGKYTYVVGNPTTLVDLLGYNPVAVIIGAIAAVAGRIAFAVVQAAAIATALVVVGVGIYHGVQWLARSWRDSQTKDNSKPNPSAGGGGLHGGGGGRIPPYRGWGPPHYGDDDNDGGDNNQEGPNSESERYDSTVDGEPVLDEARQIAEHAELSAQRGDGTHYVQGVTPQNIVNYVDAVLKGRVPGIETRYLTNGRVGYWDPSKGAVVIEDPVNGGTVFTPEGGYEWFQHVLK